MKNSLIINQTEVTYIIQFDKVLYCKADRSYCTIHLINGEIIINTRTLCTMTKHLNENFMRISQSIIVNKLHIQKILKKSKYIVLINGEQLSYTLKSGELIEMLSSKHEMRDEIADMQ